MIRVPILLYHSVDDDPRTDVRRWSVSRQQFREHMAVLRNGGWTTRTVAAVQETFRRGDAVPERTVVVTFDDGFEDVLTAALPAMEGMCGTVYVTSGYLRDRMDARVAPPGRMLHSRDLWYLAEAGFEVGVHGHRHVPLDEVRRTAANCDISVSKALVEDALGAAATSFAYPYGYHDAAVQRLVRERGFDNAVGVKNAHSHEGDDRWALARITVERGTSAERLAHLLGDPSPRIAPEKERILTTGWRAARRVRAALIRSNR